MVAGQTIGEKASNLAHQAKEAISGTQEHKATQGYTSTDTFGSDLHGRNNNAAYTGTGSGYGTEGHTYSSTGTGTGYGTGSGYGTEGQTYGSTGTGYGTGSGYEGQPATHTHTGHHHSGHHTHNAGNLGAGALGGATGGNLGSTVDTPHQTAYDGVAKHVPGTDAHDVHSANTQVGRNDYAGQPTLTDNIHGVAGRVTGGTVGSTVNTPQETTKEKVLKYIPGTEANKEKKAQEQTGF